MVTDPDAPVHLAGKRSREAAIAHDKEAWLANFADDAIVEDPIGPSHFDPEGKGHRGKEAIAAFYDKAIAPSELDVQLRKDLPMRQRGSQRRPHRDQGRRIRGHRRGRVHLPRQRRGQDRCAAGVLGTRPGHRERPQDLALRCPRISDEVAGSEFLASRWARRSPMPTVVGHSARQPIRGRGNRTEGQSLRAPGGVGQQLPGRGRPSEGDVVTDAERPVRVHAAIDPEAPLRLDRHGLGDAAIDVEARLRATGHDAADRRHEDVKDHTADCQMRTGPVGLRQVVIRVIQREKHIGPESARIDIAADLRADGRPGWSGS